MDNNLTLQPTQVSDLEKVLSLLEAFYGHFNYDYNRNEKSQTLQELWNYPDRGYFWLIEKDQTVVGYVYLSFYFSLEFGGRTAFIDELFVLPSFRGQGIGSQVIALVEKKCQQLQLKAIHLESEKTNPGATALYRKLGFVDYGRRLLTKRLNLN